MQNQIGRAILFIEIKDVKDHNGNIQQKFDITSESISILQSIQNKNVKVLTIAGPQRTGKSFLANRILKQMKGFAIGPTTAPCTKGIWMWSVPIELNDNSVLLILDTEGLNSVERDKTIDSKIFSISILLSSMFIFNYYYQLYDNNQFVLQSKRIGHIDELALEDMSLVVELSKNIQVSENDKNPNKISEFLPQFVWVLRDFSLDLQGQRPRQYMEDVLKDVEGYSSEIKQKNLIRQSIRNYFILRDCICLVRPLSEENRLANIEQENWENLRPQFRVGVQNFEKYVFQNIQVKKIQNKPLNGNMFLSLAMQYKDKLNEGGIPQILNCMEIAIAQEASKIKDQLVDEYQKQVKSKLDINNKIYDNNELYFEHKKIEIEIQNKLDQKTENLVDTQKIIELKKELQQIMDEKFKNLDETNNKKVKLMAEQMINRFMNTFKLDQLVSIDAVDTTTFNRKKEEFMTWLQKNDSSSQFAKLVNYQITPFLFDQFEFYFEQFQTVHQQELSNTKDYLSKAREGERLLRRNIQDMESVNFERQRDIQSLQSDKESMTKEFAQELQKKENEISYLKEKIIKLEANILSKREQKKKQEEENQQTQNENKDLKRQNKNLNEQVQELSQILSKQGLQLQASRLKEDFEFSPDMVNAVKNLKNQIQGLEQFHQSRQSIIHEFFNEQRKQSIESLVQQAKNMEEFKLQQQQLLKKKLKKKDEEMLQITSKMEVYRKQNEKLKEDNGELEKQIDEYQQNQQKFIHDQFIENRREQLMAKAEASIKTLEQVLSNNITQIESLQTSLGELKSQKVNLESFQEMLPFVLEQSFKYCDKQKDNKLKNAIQNLDKDAEEMIKQAFKSANIQLKL